MQRLTIWLNRLVKRKLLWALCLQPAFLSAQDLNPLTLDQAYEMARANYPMIRQKKLIEQTADLSIRNLDKGYLPQFSLGGQATYQSAVTSVDLPLPGFKLEPPSKDQYKITADVNQVIYDGGLIKEQKVLQTLNAQVEDQKVEVTLYQLKDRINQLYLGILYLDAAIKQAVLVKQDFQVGIRRVTAQVQNGVAFKSNLSSLQAEMLKTDQRVIELKASRKGLVETLGVFVNKSLPDSIELVFPVAEPVTDHTIRRPELKLYTDQSKMLLQQDQLIHAKNLPKTSLFVEGGYGRPGLNMLKNQFDWFYIGGIRLNWSFGGLYTSKKEKELVEINRRMVDLQKETFLLNTNTQLKQQEADIEKLEQLVASDQQIIDLRTDVKNAARAQLENAVITADDYTREVNAEDQARQTLITHQIQLLQAQINYQTLLGKQ